MFSCGIEHLNTAPQMNIRSVTFIETVHSNAPAELEELCFGHWLGQCVGQHLLRTLVLDTNGLVCDLLARVVELHIDVLGAGVCAIVLRH